MGNNSNGVGLIFDAIIGYYYSNVFDAQSTKSVQLISNAYIVTQAKIRSGTFSASFEIFCFKQKLQAKIDKKIFNI